MKLKKFSVILAVLLVAILAIGAVSAESVSDTDVAAVAAVDDTAGTVSVDDSIDDVSVDTTDNDVKNSLSAVALEDGESVSYEINDTSYSTYFKDDGTATDELSEMGGYTLNIGTLTNKDIQIISGSDINITAKDGEGFINNGTIILGGDEFPGSIIVSGLTFTNTNKDAIQVLDYTTDVSIYDNNMNIIGISSLSSDPNFSVYGVSANGFISGLYIENNTMSVEGDALSYGIEVGAYSDGAYALSNPQDILISGNTIDVSTSGAMAEPMYLSDVWDVTVVNNFVTAESVNAPAYGIQVADSAMWASYMDPNYDGDLSSPNNVLIDGNTFILNSDFMIYGITTINYGWDGIEMESYALPLNITVSNNNVYANSKKGVMGIAGQIYNLTVIDNTVIAIGGSAEGLYTGDLLGNGTYALYIDYDGNYAEDTYYVVVKDNDVFTNVTKEYAFNNDYERVIFENNEDLKTFVIDDETYSIFFNDDGTSDVLEDMEDYTLMIGPLNNKDIVLDSGSEIVILGLDEGYINNGTIVLDGVSDVYVSDLVFVNVNKDAFYIGDESNEIVIVDNAIVLVGKAAESTNPYFSLYAISANGYVTGLNITDNSIYITGDAPYSYGISLSAYAAEFNPEDITIYNNTIEMSLSEGSSMAEAIYLDCPSDATIEENNITIETVGNTFAYGIQVADTLPAAYEYASYRGELTSPELVTIKGNTLNISSEYMIYGITVLSEGALVNGSGDLALCQFELFLNVSENTIYADSTKGVIGLAGKVYNITMNNNDLYVTGGDASDVFSYDDLGVGTYAVGIKYNGDSEDGNYYADVFENNIFTNVSAEYINDETVLDEYVFFNNFIPLDLGIVLEADKDALEIGDLINYTITVVNNGPNAASDVYVSFELSDILLLVTAPEEYDAEFELLNVSDLAVGQEKVYNIVAQVIDGGYLLSTAYVDCYEDDTYMDNNTASLDMIAVPIVIDDSNYANYFNENGYLKDDVIATGTVVLFGNLTNKDLFINAPLLISDCKDTKLVNTTIALVEGADGTLISGLVFDYTAKDSGFAIISVNDGVSDVLIRSNNITVTDIPDYVTAVAIGVYGAVNGSEDITIEDNFINMTGGNAYTYGINVQNYDQGWVPGEGASGVEILENTIILSGTGMEEAIFLSGLEDVYVYKNTIVSASFGENTGCDAYGIAAANVSELIIEENQMGVGSNQMAFGIAITTKSNDVDVFNNSIDVEGTGAIGVGVQDSTDVSVTFNTICAYGDDFTSIQTYDSLGTANAAILDETGEALIENNTIYEYFPITISDDNYATYFDESGKIKNDSGIAGGDLIFLDELTNKALTIDIPLTIKGVPLNALVNTTITLLADASGSTVTKLNMEFTGDENTGSVGIIYVLGASDVEITDNVIIVPAFVDKTGAKYGSSLYAIEVESGADGCSYIDISDNVIDIIGSARYLYGIDVFQTWGSENKNSYVAICDNFISVVGASRMSEGIYASGVDELEILNNTITSVGQAAAYGIGTDTLTDSIISDNGMEVNAGTQAYGITNTYSDGVEITANVISSTGEGAIGIGTNSEDVTIAKNQITINGNDYTTITSADTLGTDNAAILDTTGEATIENNTITENCPITINDGNYATYFDENGSLKNNSGIADGDLIFFGELSNKKFNIDNYLIIKGANNNKLVNTTIALTAGASGSTLSRLNMEFTGDNTTGSVGLIYVLGASDIEISQNTITVIDFVDKAGAKYGSSLYAIEVESGENGCSFIDISNNIIDITGSARYLYGIDVFQTWQAPMRNSDIAITNNFIMIDPASRMSEGIYASGIDNAIIANNTIISESDAAAYGIGTDSLANSTIADNVVRAAAATQAYGITNTYSTNVDIVNNTVNAEGIGAVGIGFMGSEGVTVADNLIAITGGDYTSITSSDSLGTANAAILDKDNKGTISYNNVTENIPVTINDGNYDNYFNEDGYIRNDSGFNDGDLVFFEKLSNKNIVLDMPLTVKGAPGNKLVNTTITVLDDASGSTITCLDMEFTGDENTGSVGIIYVLGASDVEISYNNITVPNFVDKTGAKYGSSLYAIEVESGQDGCSYVDISNNIIDITGSARYLYGIDVFQTWQAPNKNSYIAIADNEISIQSASRMSEGIYASGIEFAEISNNIINSVGEAAAYGIGTDTLSNSIIEDNDIVVLAGTQAYGVTSTYSDTVNLTGNNISAVGVGAIGVGSNSDNVNIDKNEISILGQDYTAITSADSLGTGNAAILDKGTKTTIGNNTIEEVAPIIIEDNSYDKYFDENGQIKEDAPIGSGDVVYMGVLTGKDMVFDIPVAILPADNSKLTDSTIKVVEGADGTTINGLDIEYTGDENTGSKNIINVVGASDVTISNNNIIVPDFVNKAGSKYGSSVAAIAVESGAAGTDNTTITGNNIEVNGSANYLYGIDAFTTWGANTTNSNLKIENNNVSVNGGARMAEAVYVSDSKNVTIDNNDVEASSEAAAYGIATDQLSHAKITDNDVAVLAGTTGYGITATTSGEDVLIESNDVEVLGMSAIGVGLSNQDAAIVKDNTIDIIGGDYSSVTSADNLGTANAAILDKDNKNTNLVVENNTMTENGKAVNTTHSGNSSAELQAIIDAAPAGSTVDLDGVLYADISNVVIDKNLTITNGTIVGKAGEAIFVIPAKSENGPDEVNINGMEFLVNDATVIAKATADNGTTPTSIDTPAISIKNNTIDMANDDVVPESVTVLELDSERGVLAPTSEIAVEGNTIATGVDPFEFKVTGVADDSGNVVVEKGGNIPAKQASVIHYQDMETTAVNSKIEGRVGKYFEVNLTDTNGNPLANKFVQIGFNGVVYNRTTNETGGVKLQINLGYKGTYTFAISYLGDDYYNGSFVVSKIKVSTQNTKLTTAAKTYKASAKTKTLTATLKSSVYNKPINGKKVTFTVNGKSYSATTNAKGVATVKVSLSTKKTYSFTAKFAGDDMYTKSSVTGKVTIK
ncbi:adhesin-like protein [Methanobrevibacter ruminantium M1]|uniref:Adhesin-like protein n=1 Tax=Methanobrevibacter ruminantium (strain ATCC 35063 / DSM 1093 / JCM 13430 / OCM 146 / M1) TaxID=634498 RepID=D3E0T1_METRM|nr:right-handed parallel beta-helix repeat-containing protein [Methanobrevibacter ruminantium]ADC47905.1 adhesin-like protein [Methanobrevibacter ruminantium M1]